LLERALTAAEAIGYDEAKAQALGALAERHRNHKNYCFINTVLEFLPELNRISALLLIIRALPFNEIDDNSSILLINVMLDVLSRWK
jgi:hypothetical protein